MEIAVLGGGSAGFMAAAHLSRELPRARLHHVFDPRIPAIGVGESTTPVVPRWLEQVGDIGLAELRRRCDATPKRAGCFEDWGTHNRRFLNRFQPTGEQAVHLDAGKLCRLLGERSRAERIDAYVTGVELDGERRRVELEDGRALACDFVIDARGFPAQDDPDLLTLDWIPTDAALVQFTRPLDCPEITRNVARPHGWVFLIPLGDRTSVGYVYRHELSTREEVEADLDALLEQEGGEPLTPRRNLRFPNFTRRTFFDGGVMRVGNTASFTEPLEALSIGTVVLQLRSFVQWLRGDRAAESLPAFNESLMSYVRRNSIVLAWHYAAGSRFDTPFWSYARAGFARAKACPELASDLARFDRFLEIARDLTVDDLDTIGGREQWMRDVFPRLRLYRPYGNFSELNVAQVGHGIGWFQEETRHHAEHR